MKNRKILLEILTAVIAVLMISSTLTLCSSAVELPSTYATPLSTAKDYGDLLQYPWPQAGYDEGFSCGNPGPGPDRPNVLWKVATSGSSVVSVFDGKAFVSSGTTVYAYDALSGQRLYISNASGTAAPTGNNAIFQLDNTYFLTQGGTGITVRRISDGSLVWSYSFPEGAHGMPGSGSYFGGRYSTSMKLWLMTFSKPSDVSKQTSAGIVAIDLSNPAVAQTQPKWTLLTDASGELLCCGDGMAFMGTTEGDVVAVNANGQVVWQTALLGGVAQQAAIYYNHKLYISAVSWYLTCLDGATGEMLWQTLKGIRAFTAYHGCAGAGMIFDETDEIDPYGSVGAWDAETGERIWKNAAYFSIRYDTMAYADGKVYGIKSDRAGGQVSTLAMPDNTSFSCWDAYTGTELWNWPNVVFTYPSIAYGNLYGTAGGYLYCIGGSPTDWSMGFIGNVEQPRVAIGQQGPTDISTAKWAYQTGGDVFSSPAIVDGRVFFGSKDKNIYCLDAFTGQKIWNFTTGFYVRSSQAVYGGRVYTGSDDGFFYGLDANTGAQIWKTATGGIYPNLLNPGEAKAFSSPIIVNNMIYCGSRDAYLYCLSLDGRVQWKFLTGDGIGASPGYANGIVYINSMDGYLYAVNAITGTQVWKSGFKLNYGGSQPIYSSLYNIGAVTVANGVVYTAGGVQYGQAITMSAFNATTGASIWNVTRAGNSQPYYYPCYVNGYIYAPEFFMVTKMNATKPLTGNVQVPGFSGPVSGTGNRSWVQWLGYQIQGSIAYSDDLTGPKIYVGSDIGSMYVLNAIDGTSISVFTAGGNVPCSPSIWDGKMYIGCTDGKLYCFDDSPVVDFNVNAASDKGSTMWNNETLSIGGRLTSSPKMAVWDYSTHRYLPQASEYTPGLPNATVKVSFTHPDGSSENVSVATDQHGYFNLSKELTTTGSWSWIAYYEGMRNTGLTYSPAYGEYQTIAVEAAPVEPTAAPTATASPTPIPATPTPTVAPTPTPTPTPTGSFGSSSDLFIIAAVVVIIVVIAVAAYMVYTRRKKPNA
jgi:eukaryotic-like serine/threonine-protein kinase